MLASNSLLFILHWCCSTVQRVLANKKPLFGYSLLFVNNNLLFYALFYVKIEICSLYKRGFIFTGILCMYSGSKSSLTLLYPRVVLNTNEFYALLLHRFFIVSDPIG